MKNIVLFLVLLLPVFVQAQTELIEPALTGEELINHLQANYSVTNAQSYNAARDAMFEEIDGPDGMISCVYTGYTISFTDRSDAQGSQAPDDFNTEHVWPQSFFDSELPMRSDIHHLYPTRVDVNGARSNFPFAEIQDNQTDSWWRTGDIGRTSIPTSNIDEYSELLNGTSFEPREDLKGNIARSIFYFWTIYQNNPDVVNDGTNNEAFFEDMQHVLLQWHIQDPVDSTEVNRSIQIEEVQGNINPFIHDTTLVRRAYFGAPGIVEDTLANPIQGMVKNITESTLELVYQEQEHDTTIQFSYTEQLLLQDTMEVAYLISNYDSLYAVAIEWEARTEQGERVATVITVFEFEAPGLTSTEIEDIPLRVTLSQNYPNPFNPGTTISYSIDSPGMVSLALYNASGAKITTLVDEFQTQGEHRVQFSAENLASGLYLYRIDFEGHAITKKMTIIK